MERIKDLKTLVECAGAHNINAKTYTEQKERYRAVVDLVKTLAEYKDLEEQGLLVRLPVKVGDAVYLADSSLMVVHPFEVRLICLNKCETTVEVKYTGNDKQFHHWVVRTEISKIGTWIFLTKAEAEAALERMGE